MSTPNLDTPEGYSADVIAAAVKFTASLFLGRGKYANAEAATLDEIKAEADKLIAANPASKSKPIITAFDADGNSVPLGAANKAAKKSAKGKSGLARRMGKGALADVDLKALGLDLASAKPANEGKGKGKGGKKAASKAAAPKAAAPKAGKKAAAPKANGEKPKTLGARAQKVADAEAGKVPDAPDFSAATHARFRKKLEEVKALVEAADIKALKAYAINPISSSPKAIAKYRDLAVTALEAQKAAAKKAAKADA